MTRDVHVLTKSARTPASVLATVRLTIKSTGIASFVVRTAAATRQPLIRRGRAVKETPALVLRIGEQRQCQYADYDISLEHPLFLPSHLYPRYFAISFAPFHCFLIHHADSA